MKRIKKNLIADFTFENNTVIATQSKKQSDFVRTLRVYSIYNCNAIILKYQNVRVFLRGYFDYDGKDMLFLPGQDHVASSTQRVFDKKQNIKFIQKVNLVLTQLEFKLKEHLENRNK